MAGKRHHIIPRFLQKGFASRIDGKNVFTWFYRKNLEPREFNTLNTFVENYFYGKEGELNADVEITNLETSDFSPLLDNLRILEGSVDSFRSQIAGFISNLTVRTKLLRNSFIESSNYISDELGQYFSDNENIKNLLSNPQLIENEIKNVLNSPEVDELLANSNLQNISFLKEILPDLVKSEFPKILEEENNSITTFFQMFFEKTSEAIPDGIKKGQIKALIENPTPDWITEYCEKLNWFVCKSSSPLILGDTGCISEVNGNRNFKPIAEKGDEIINIFLPISYDKVLVGTTNPLEPKINVKILNSAIAKCSFEQFISSEYTTEKATLIDSIGMWSELLSLDEMEKLRKEMIDDIVNFNNSSEEND